MAAVVGFISSKCLESQKFTGFGIKICSPLLQCAWEPGEPTYSWKLQLWSDTDLTLLHWPNIWLNGRAHLVDSGKFRGCMEFSILYLIFLCAISLILKSFANVYIDRIVKILPFIKPRTKEFHIPTKHESLRL